MPVNLRQQPSWLVCTGGAAVAVALTWMAYAWVVVPNHERSHKAQEIRAAAAAEHATAQQLHEQLAVLAEVLQQRREALDALPLKLGNRRDLNRQIASLIELAHAHGLEVMQLQPGQTSPGDHYDLTALRLEAIAGFPDHLDFLDALHASFPDVSVVGMDLESSPREANPRPRVALSMVWFTTLDGSTVSQISTPNGR